jgi:hypothetical protein
MLTNPPWKTSMPEKFWIYYQMYSRFSSDSGIKRMTQFPSFLRERLEEKSFFSLASRMVNHGVVYGWKSIRGR